AVRLDRLCTYPMAHWLACGSLEPVSPSLVVLYETRISPGPTGIRPPIIQDLSTAEPSVVATSSYLVWSYCASSLAMPKSHWPPRFQVVTLGLEDVTSAPVVVAKPPLVWP